VGGSSITRLRNGETVSVRTGVLRGAGPQGPMGPQGPAGPAGAQGVPGPMGQINDAMTRLTSTASVPLSNSQWYDMAIENVVLNELVDIVDAYSFKVSESGNYVVAISADFALPAGAGSGKRSIRLTNSAGAVTYLTGYAEGVANDITVVRAADVLALDASVTYKVQGRTNDPLGAISCVARSVSLLRAGMGPAGPEGPEGPVGLTGPQGPAGPTGPPGTGYSSFNTLDVDGDATVVPAAGNNTTADQGVAYPSGTAKPKTVYYLRHLAEFFEKRIVARFATAAARTAARPAPAQGEVWTLVDTGAWYTREKNGSEPYLARVIVSSSAPPAGGGQAAPGVIWIQT